MVPITQRKYIFVDGYEKIQAFRDKYKDKGIYFTYSSDEEFKKMFFAHLSMHFLTEKRVSETANEYRSELKLLGIDETGRLTEEAVVCPFVLNAEITMKEYITSIKNMYQEISDMNVGGRSVTANTFFAGFTSPVDIDEDEKEFITAVAEQLERKLSDSFFELGNLNQDTLTSNLLSGPKLNGTSEEKQKYWKIKRLHETISKALEWAPVEKAFSGMNCIKLAIQNCGKAIDEDAEIMFEVPKESLLTLGEFPKFNNAEIGYLLTDCDMSILFGIEGTSEYIEYSESEQNGRTSYGARPYGLPGYVPDYSDDFTDEIKDVFCYGFYSSEDKYIVIAEKGLLRGESSIVQLPTGVGKTRSIELIIRAAFLSERANIAIIVAPLRALCNEITMDMYKAFGNDVTINQFSDVLQNDFWNLFSEDIKRQILICTPEKLSYVLHHDPFFLSAIDLFVFDEGHMFDDGGRGATYELLVTHIRQNITSEQQLVLLSAVLPNSGDIAQWLFEDRGCLATDDSIVSTPKSIGFSSTQRDIHFFSDDKSNEDYYIPRILRVEQLKKLPRERSNKYFPDLSLSTDVAIYNAIKLCHNGGVAIYLGQQRSMKTVFERIINLDKRNYDLKALKDNTNQAELSKIKGFIESYYGSEHYYTKAAELGVLPHSSNLQNGVKLVVEHALKNKYVSCVVCTSTLAQGVNIPIKYLLVTSIRNGLKLVKARDFQNLMGRTARAGIYTEGSIIITDCKIYDNRTNWKNGGRYLWNDCVKLFDTKLTEPCGSSIVSA